MPRVAVGRCARTATVRLFLDSVNLAEVRDVLSWGVLSGVTTNPSLCVAEGVEPRSRIIEIARLVPGPVTASIVASSRDEMVAMGRDLAAAADNIVVQFPVDAESLAACRILSEAGVRVSMVLVFSTAQAILCANAGAAYCAPFVSRLDDIGADGMALLEEIAQVYAVQGFPTELMAMSLQSPAHVIGAARGGADMAAIPYDVFVQMVANPLTELGAQRFAEDWAVSTGQWTQQPPLGAPTGYEAGYDPGYGTAVQ